MNKPNNKNKDIIVENCILSLAKGDINAMNLLYETTKTDVYAYAISKVCNKYDADDILQDTYVRIYENAKLYTPVGSPMGWIIAIEKNVINRHYQVTSKNISLETIQEDPLVFERKIIENEYLKILLSNLNQQEREIISLHVVSGFKFKEISEMTKLPLATVLSKYNRAIKKLQKIVKEEK